MKSVAVIGAGFAGLSASVYLANKGFNVTVFEKNAMPGGRACNFSSDGFIYDMGPSWYWMPDVFSRYFEMFGRNVEDFYDLIRLDPSYRVFFGKNDYIDVPANLNKLYDTFESIENGSSKKLQKFLADAEFKYNFGIKKLVYKPGNSVLNYLDWKVFSGLIQIDIFKSVYKVIRDNFNDIRLIRILEFPVLFLGSTPQKTPSLYSFMNYADLVLGTWYPIGGMYKVVEAFVRLAKSYNVEIKLGSPVSNFNIKNKTINGLWSNNRYYTFDYVIGSADYQHIDQELIDSQYRSYSRKYWNSRVFAPSAVLLYLGVNKKINRLLHHNLVFDTDLEQHFSKIYHTPDWPEKPAIYISCPSKSDSTVAPTGHENITVLIPAAPGLSDNDSIREYYFNYSIDKIEEIIGESIRNNIIFKRVYSQQNFISDYNSYKGNAYGLANNLSQTAFLKPRMKSKKINNLYFAGQLTNPGPGVPSAIISGEIAARRLVKNASK